MKIFRILIIIFLSLIIIISLTLGFLYIKNISASKEWRKSPPLPGKLYEVNGINLYSTIKGSGKTVIIESDLGGSSVEWWKIQDEILKYARVITYDRAGYGWSDQSKNERTAQQINKDLKQLVNKLKCQRALCFSRPWNWWFIYAEFCTILS